MKIARAALPLGLLITASTLPGAARADTLIDNVQGLTFTRDGSVERFSAILIGNDGRIAQVLRQDEKRPSRVDYLLDGKGRVLLPGLVDGHAEVMELGLAALTLNLSETRTLAEAQAKVAAYAAAHPDRAWIVGRGWDAARWGLAKRPGAAELDGVVPDRPVWLISADGHAGWANSAALKAAGITALTKDPAGGRIERAMPGNKPTGALVETALALVDKAVPPPRPEDLDLALATAQDLLLARGITTVTDMGSTIEDWQAFRRAGDAGRLRMRVVSYAAGTGAMSLIGGPGPSPWLYEDRLKLNGVLLTLDGAPGTGGAWLKTPPAGAATPGGLPRLNPTQLRNLMSRAAIDRFQVALTAHGDGAAAAALDAVEELSATYKGDRRWRIEDLTLVAPAELPRFANLGAMPTLRPDAGSKAPATLAAALKANGAPLAFGSASTAAPPAPFAVVAAAAGQPGAMPAGLTREAALAAFTTGAAHAAFAETRIGRIAVGLRADFILLDRDPLLNSTAELAQTKVLETWVGGRKAWSAPEPR